MSFMNRKGKMNTGERKPRHVPDMPKLCKCPYCFKKFAPNLALFKAQTVYTEQDLEDLSEEEKARKEPYCEVDDAAYTRFWRDFPGSTTGFKYERNPIIANGEVHTEYLSYQKKTFDSDNFLYQVTDTEHRTTKIRICPHCHNPLPHEYGKYPVKYIAVVGITSSGKTVFLAQLLAKIQEFLSRAGLTVLGMHDEADDFVRKHPIKRDKPLPAGNAAHVLTPPIPLNVVNTKTHQKYTLVFYDIAGENCVKSNRMNKFGRFVENADGIIMIIDPQQFSNMFHMEDERDGREDPASPTKVIEAMYDDFLSARNDKIPIAVALSKSDMLRDYYGKSDMNMFHEICYNHYEDVGFPYDDYLNIETEVQELLEPRNEYDMQGKLLRDQLKELFPDSHGFFAFSALNAKPVRLKSDKMGVYSVLREDPTTIRIEEPVLWLLYRMGLIGKAVGKRNRR